MAARLLSWRPLVIALLPLVGSLRAPAPRCCAAQPASTKELYARIDGVLRRARSRGNSVGASTARSLGNRWLEMEPAALVEATLVSGATVLQDFDEGFEILREAEDGAALNVSGTAYSALMRLAQSEERPVEALALLARTRAYAVERTDGLLLSAMRAAAALEDWGAVARLYTELAAGPEVAAELALELETFADAKTFDDLRSGSEAAAAKQQSDLAQALSLALRAHCERGDVSRVIELLPSLRAGAGALDVDGYRRLAALAVRARSAAPLLALRPIDAQRSSAAVVEPQLFALQARVGLAAAALGRVERVLALLLLLAPLLAALAALAGAFDASDAEAASSALGSTASALSDSIDSLTSVPGLY